MAPQRRGRARVRPCPLQETTPKEAGGDHRKAPDAAQGDEQRALTTLAHTSLTALAKRSPAEFRNAAAGFSNDTRTRMETALREQAAAASAPQMRAGAGSASAAAAPAAKPKIALTMNFGAFGK